MPVRYGHHVHPSQAIPSLPGSWSPDVPRGRCTQVTLFPTAMRDIGEPTDVYRALTQHLGWSRGSQVDGVLALSGCAGRVGVPDDQEGDVVLGGMGADHPDHEVAADPVGGVQGERASELVEADVEDAVAAFDKAVGVEHEQGTRG